MSHARKTAVIGAGGKTSALAYLAAQLSHQRVVLTTTTHIFPFAPPDCDKVCISPDVETLRTALASPGILCTGMATPDCRKLTALTEPLFDYVLTHADHVIYEADGARRMPLKLHADHEPVILPDTEHCLIVAGLSALGQPIGQAVHRFTMCPDWAQHPDRLVDTQVILACIYDAIRASKMPISQIEVWLNQADHSTLLQQAQPILHLLRAQGITCQAICLKEAKNQRFGQAK